MSDKICTNAYKFAIYSNLVFMGQGSGLSISFEVDVRTGKVGGSLLFERRRCKFPRGGLGACPPENFEIYILENALFNAF